MAVGEVVDSGEHLPHTLGVVLGEPLCLGEGLGPLKTAYTYDSAGRLATLTPPGQLP
ncbi:hypothetical protein [Streptomyces sp. NPDC001275]